MKKSAMMVVLIWILSQLAYAKGGNVNTVSFPFQYVALDPGRSLQVNYSFRDSDGLTHPIIFCFLGNNLTSSLTWPYNGQQFTANIPLTLKIDPIYTGEFADFSGTFHIRNTADITIYVSCLYGF